MAPSWRGQMTVQEMSQSKVDTWHLSQIGLIEMEVKEKIKYFLNDILKYFSKKVHD